MEREIDEVEVLMFILLLFLFRFLHFSCFYSVFVQREEDSDGLHVFYCSYCATFALILGLIVLLLLSSCFLLLVFASFLLFRLFF